MMKVLDGLANKTWPLWVLAVVQLLIQVGFLAKGGVQYAVTSLTIDDTFYYLQTAWNAHHVHFVSFDGINPTNGVQALWFVVIYGISGLTHDKTTFLYAVLGTCMLLNVACYWAIWKLCNELQMRWLSLVLAGLWALQTLASDAYVSGMENSLHALIFWLLMWQTVAILRVRPEGGFRRYAGFAALLILNSWSRLDAALFSGFLLLFVLLYDVRRKSSVQPAILCGVVVAVGLAAQLQFFHMLDNSYLPVSALIKTSASSRESSVAGFIDALKMSLPKTGVLSAAALLVVLVLGYQRLRMKAGLSSGLAALMKLYVSLAVAFAAYNLSIAISKISYREYFFWYRSPMYIFWMLTIGVAAALIVDSLRQESQATSAKSLFALVGAMCALASVAVAVHSTSLHRTNLYTLRYRTAKWIEANYAPDVRFASWNAGAIAYFSNRSVVNMDGLINSVEFYKNVLRGSEPLKEFLTKSGVQYVVDYQEHDLSQNLPVVHVSPVVRDKGNDYRFTIWRLDTGSVTSDETQQSAISSANSAN